ncbi:nucleosome assembly protein 1-like 1 [Bactrocera tryoni]|uniref:nucleosome assembly protein 1-like 1 n=1 Tax=Bactrocera tryoni TaxID=59916 RepID=UPI001A975F8D|nr:nucleosome assembly protein 1-like 1 [Bactrocera tryoni]
MNMESMKMRSLPKIPVSKQNSVASAKKTADKKFSEDESKTITELKKLYLETIKLDVDLQKEIYNMEKAFEVKHNTIFEKRAKLLDDYRKQAQDDTNTESNLSNFWLRVLKASYTEFISKKDEKILTHLTDIRSTLCNDPIVMFIIEFHFEPNEFFSNTILTKTYFLNCLPDVDDPLSYDGAEIYKCEGCKIDWKQNNSEKDKKSYTSFFDFFSPPTLPEDTEDPNYCDINAILQNDFELGFYLKERVIPKAVMFFTGEIADCQSSDSESEDTDDEDDDDDDDDDEEESSNNEANED